MDRKEEPILRVVNLKKHFPLGGRFFGKSSGSVKAVDGVNLEIESGQTVALVGESGCGKTTLGRAILRLIDITSGEIYYKDVNLLNLNRREMREMRMNMQLVQQDIQSALDPRMTIKASVGEGLVVYGIDKGKELREKVLSLLQKVGLGEEHLNRFPQEFSGGQRQRICISRALALNPKFIILDEPTASLDVSVQAQILNLLRDLQNEFELTYLFISHDLSVVRYISDEVYVMYLGKIVEKTETRKIFKQQLHPYTRTLFSAIPIPDPSVKRERLRLKGEVPSAINPPSGCSFHPRCPDAKEMCSEVRPELRAVEEGHLVACHLYN